MITWFNFQLASKSLITCFNFKHIKIYKEILEIIVLKVVDHKVS